MCSQTACLPLFLSFSVLPPTCNISLRVPHFQVPFTSPSKLPSLLGLSNGADSLEHLGLAAKVRPPAFLQNTTVTDHREIVKDKTRSQPQPWNGFLFYFCFLCKERGKYDSCPLQGSSPLPPTA